jgi:hypothetical protein
MLGLNFAQAGSVRNGSESARVVGKTVTQTEQNRVPPHDSSTETAKPSSRKS